MKKAFGFLIFFIILSGAIFLIFKPYKYDFKGISDDKTKISLKNFDNKYKAIYFGFLYCPDVCPTTLMLLGDALKKLGRDDFELIFITLDPERDEPKNLTLMAKNFYPQATGIRLKNLAKTAKNYGVKYKKIAMPNSAMSYSIAHSSAIYLLDKKGKFYAEISNLTPQNIEANLRSLIKDRP